MRSRKALLGTVVFAIAATAALIATRGESAAKVNLQQTASTTNNTAQQYRADATEQYRTRVANDLQQAAKAVGVRIDEKQLLITTRNDALISVAPAYEKKDVFLFMHASFAANSTCANVFPEGDYSVRIVPTKSGEPTRTEYINASGKVVARGQLMAETRKANPEEKGQLQVGIQLRHTGGLKARTVFGVCRCQWIPLFRWRRLHSVVV